MSDQQIQALYSWIDEVPLSRPKRNISRDFSDGVMAAELIKHFIPRLVDLHNYPPANSITQKMYNWNTLQQKALRKLGINLDDDKIADLANCKPGVIEEILLEIKSKRRSSGGSNMNFGTGGSIGTLSMVPAAPMQPPQPQMMSPQQYFGMVPYGGQPSSPYAISSSPQQQPTHHLMQSPIPSIPPYYPQQQPTMYNQPTMLPQLSPMSGMTLTAAGQPQQQQQQQQAFQQQQQLLQQALQPSVNLKSSPVKAANATQQKHKLPSPPSQPQPSRQSPRRRSSEAAVASIGLDVKLQEKDKIIANLKETIEILQLKVQKMEHLLTLKEKRLEELTKHRTGGTAAGSGGGGASAEYHHKQYSR